MTLIKKLFVLLSLVTMLAPLACTDHSVHEDENAGNPLVIELLQSIDAVELAEARGLVLNGVSPDTTQIFKRVLNRSKMGAGILREDDASLIGLTEIYRSQEELNSLPLLSEDLDAVGVYRSTLNRTIQEIGRLQDRIPIELGDPTIYRALYSQTFDLQEKLGEFSTFIQYKTTTGPRLFESRQCGNVPCVETNVNQKQAVWLVSPKLSLPETGDLTLQFTGSIKGNSTSPSVQGFKLYVSESFNGRFINEEEWTDITAMISSYPANNNKYTPFDLTIPLDIFQGKALTFAFRTQGTSSLTTSYQLNNFKIMGKGVVRRSLLTLVSPEPLFLAGGFSTDHSGFKYDGIEYACEIDDKGMYTINDSCRISFDSDTASDALLRYDADKVTPLESTPFRKFTYSSSTTGATKGYTVTALNSGWRGTGCSTKPSNPLLQKDYCAERSAQKTWDLLVGPKLRFNGNYTVKIFYSIVGPSMNTATATVTPNVVNRFRVLAFDDLLAGERLEFVNAGTKSEFAADNANYDLQLSSYPQVDVTTAANARLFEATLDKTVLAAKIASGVPFRLALLQNLLGASKGSTASHVYAITFKAEN